MIGVRSNGRKELIAPADGYRESTESWADLLCDATRRGVCAPRPPGGRPHPARRTMSQPPTRIGRTLPSMILS